MRLVALGGMVMLLAVNVAFAYWIMGPTVAILGGILFVLFVALLATRR